MCSGADQRGFTLLEVIAALTITCVVLSVVLGRSAADLRASHRAAERATAAVLTENLLARGRVELRPLLAGGGKAQGRFSSPFEAYTWSVIAGPVPGERQLVDLRIRVAWPKGEFSVATRARSPRESTPAMDLP